MQEITSQTGIDVPPSALPRTRLDGLLLRSSRELQRAYEDATTPSIDEVEGDLRGRMLATTILRGRTAAFARAWASSKYFPWRGKSFRPLAPDRGEGINRVFSDRLKLYRFETSIQPSLAGDFTCVELDYDLPENPFFIRAIRDEIRSLGSGLYLGQAYLVIGDRRRRSRDGEWGPIESHSMGRGGAQPPRKKGRLVLYFGLARA